VVDHFAGLRPRHGEADDAAGVGEHFHRYLVEASDAVVGQVGVDGGADPVALL
jgi:hypothetical protein